MELVRGTCVLFEDKGVLLTGSSGAGKSDLALRLIERGGKLVGDDYVETEKTRGGLAVKAPGKIAGKIEIRGIGIRKMEYAESAPLDLVVNLVPRAKVPRLADKKTTSVAGVRIPYIELHAFDPSTPFKISMVLNSL